MGILKATPKSVEVRASTAPVAGGVWPVEVVIVTDEAVKVDGVEVSLIGEQGWSVGAGQHRTTERLTYPELAARVMEAGELPAAARTSFPVRFLLPPDLPPSHEVGPAFARLSLQVRVEIPWWPDQKRSFEVRARIPPPADVSRTPVAIRSDAAPGEPRLELALASTRLIAGEEVIGSCAVYHLDDREPRELRLVLTPTLGLLGRRRQRERQGDGLAVTLTVPAGSAGSSLPFRFRLPPTITPTFATATHRLDWALTASVGSFLRGKVSFTHPVEIVDAAGAVVSPPLPRAPRLGDQRVAAMLDRFAAAEDWRRAGGDERDPEALAIEREHAGCALRLAYAYRGRDGTFLTGRIAHPRLGLRLSVAPGSALRDFFSDDIEVGIAAWDRTHEVAARDAAQATPLLRAVVPALIAAEALGRLVRWDDDELVLERSIASLDDRDLPTLAIALERLAGAIAAAVDDVEPPPGLSADLAAWRALAAELDGRLCAGDLSIAGRLDRIAVELGLDFDEGGRPIGVRVAVGDPDQSGAALRAHALDLPRDGWPDDVVELRLADGVASGLLRLGDAPAADAAKVRRLIHDLRRARASYEASSPYR